MNATPAPVDLAAIPETLAQAGNAGWTGQNDVVALTAARLTSAAIAFQLSDVEAMPVTHMTLTLAGRDQLGRDVILKAPLAPHGIPTELDALRVIPTSPQPYAATDLVLLTERVHGTRLKDTDADALASLLRIVHPAQRVIPANAVTWDQVRHDLLDEPAARILARANQPLASLALETNFRMGRLLDEGTMTLCHGDFQASHVVSTPTGPRLINPIGVIAPAGWDVAIAACSVIAAGGNADRIIATGHALGVCRLGEWLKVAAVAIGGNPDYAYRNDVADKLVRFAHSLDPENQKDDRRSKRRPLTPWS